MQALKRSTIRGAWIVLLAALPVAAHMISMSTGTLNIEGPRARYELRIPAYELQHAGGRMPDLLAEIRFSSNGEDARMIGKTCAYENGGEEYVCRAQYVFRAPPETIDVRCTLYRTTVPNHVHLLRAENGGRSGQAVLDMTFDTGRLDFAVPGAVSVAASAFFSGGLRTLAGLGQLLFLATILVAAHTRRELWAMAAAAIGGQTLAAVLLPTLAWYPSQRFAEAAVALTIAYLALDVLLVPAARHRWVVVLILGVFHGLYFDVFLRAGAFSPAFFLAGAAAAEVALLLLMALVFSRLTRWIAAARPLMVCRSLLAVAGLTWFIVRLRG
ncbi:MAG: HupE/UreJ family protein [Bryobacteraceae bacterium]|nr:HupE/UreJ family protein [Bryobacterales bacterium]MEB2363824.1 HupE/UreJ family protein [Bryobacterales bacterium]NUN02714.1 HupE/UreJ family protein [Bryobacteraceae bacterium]